MDMMRDSIYVVFGYLCGSILSARVCAAILQRGDITAKSADGNPGTTNAFLYGGFWCGFFTLCGDLLKGFIPVWAYLRHAGPNPHGIMLTFVIAAPLIGHIFPVFYRFRGGKGIAVTFGCLLGLTPNLRPVLVLAGLFLFFSLVVRITPHYDRTIWTYLCAAVGMYILLEDRYIIAGFWIITAVVIANLRFSDEKKEKCQVRLLWTR